MYLANLSIENFRLFGEGAAKLNLPLRRGLTALVGENDGGKTAIIDALRFVLGTRDQEYLRLDETDFHQPEIGPSRREIRIQCKFDELTTADVGSFSEFLSYQIRAGKREPVLFVTWVAKATTRGPTNRKFYEIEMRSGEQADGPTLDAGARHLLCTTYLRPLRDAERAMSSGRGSRLSQILQYTEEITKTGASYNPTPGTPIEAEKLSVLGIGDYANDLLQSREGIKGARTRLNRDYLEHLSLSGDILHGHISVNPGGDDALRLRLLLEKFELELRDSAAPHKPRNRGLGSNNLLFMACELLLLGAEEEGFPLLLIEEPEAHLHPQRQLRLMRFLENQVEEVREDKQKIQIIVTTHSPVLASALKLENLVFVQNKGALPLAPAYTKLEQSDYRFLERFLDATKANLFFARGVIVVEGDAENILLPTIARLLGRDLTRHGVSIVNVGGTGLRRFARVFLRANSVGQAPFTVRVACITDFDVMPDCAPAILGLLKDDGSLPAKRNWRVKSDFKNDSAKSTDELAEHRNAIRSRAHEQSVMSFVADEWTLEYDLAYAGLAEEVYVAASLALHDDVINRAGAKSADVKEKVVEESLVAFKALLAGNLPKEELATRVYALFRNERASKAIGAQYLAERLEAAFEKDCVLAAAKLRLVLPPYIVAALEYCAPDAPAIVVPSSGAEVSKNAT